jgi:hypothetical protein
MSRKLKLIRIFKLFKSYEKGRFRCVRYRLSAFVLHESKMSIMLMCNFITNYQNLQQVVSQNGYN